MADAATQTGTAMMLVVAAALVDPAGRVLVQRRPPGAAHAGLWEFPGGKVEADETPEAALSRELREELAIEVPCDAMVPGGFARGRAGGRPMLLLLYLVRRWHGEPRALAADALAWHDPGALPALSMPEADRPLAATLSRLL